MVVLCSDVRSAAEVLRPGAPAPEWVLVVVLRQAVLVQLLLGLQPVAVAEVQRLAVVVLVQVLVQPQRVAVPVPCSPLPSVPLGSAS